MATITLSQARTQIQNYQSNNPNKLKCVSLSKQDVLDVLNQTNCIGLRIFLSMPDTTKPNEWNAVLSGINNDGTVENGSSMNSSNSVLENGGASCPPDCNSNTVL